MTYGPIDFLAVEFPGNKLQGRILPALLEQVENGTIRIIDLVVIQKDAAGELTTRELQELDPETMRIFDPLKVEITSMITRSDIDMIAAKLENESTAALLLTENLWAIKIKQAILDANGKLIMQERIPHDVVMEALEDIAVFASSK